MKFIRLKGQKSITFYANFYRFTIIIMHEQQNLPSKPYLIFFAMILVVSSHKCNEQQCKTISIGDKICKICFKQCPAEFQFQLEKCSVLTCDKNPFAGKCSHYSYQQLNQNTCMTQCCAINHKSFEKLSPHQLQICLKLQKEEQEQQQLQSIFIVMTIVLGITFFLTITVCICCRNRIRKFWTGDQENQEINIGKNYKISSKRKRKQWIYPSEAEMNDSFSQLANKQEVECTICLSSDTNCRTACSHRFHGKCLAEWQMRTVRCPNCNNGNLNPISMLCVSCQKVIVVIPQFNKKEWKMYKKRNKNFQCQKCKLFST